MNGGVLCRATCVVMAALVMLSASLRAETATLALKRLERAPNQGLPAAQRFMASVYAQSYFQQLGVEGRPVEGMNHALQFGTVVKKQPAEYKSKYPFRGVANLGSQQFGFVLDTTTPAKEPEKKAADKPDPKPSGPPVKVPPTLPLERYDRLYFDVNHNGDLTDDPVIEAQSNPRGGSSWSSQYAQFTFPLVNLTLDVEGTKVEYAFLFSIYSRTGPGFQYASASLNAAAYREGEITVDGKSHRIILVDFNSNGRFDDRWVIADRVTMGGGSIDMRSGDMLYVDPQRDQGAARYGYDPLDSDEQQYLGKLINLGGRFFEVAVSPAGDKLTLTPSAVPTGHVHNANKGFRAVVYGDSGFVKLAGDESGRALLPAGAWKLQAYRITHQPTGDEAKQAKKPSLLDALAAAMLAREPGGGRISQVAARATAPYPAVNVRAGETAEMPFGPPYKPTVIAHFRQPDGTVILGMSIIGVAGEECSDLVVHNSRPDAPEFVITDPGGKEVHRGKFEFG